MENLEKYIDPKILEKVMSLRLMDDDLMTKVFSDDIEATEFILRILMKNENLKVLECYSQKELRNLFGRSIRLDILAEDSNHNLVNIEIQRASKGAEAKRIRFHAAMIDSHFLEKNKTFDALKDTYLIFITENDLFKRALPIYEINKIIKGTNLTFEDGLHILYVNGEYRGNDALGILMHDFNCKNPNEMKYKKLAEKVKYYKQNVEEIKQMGGVMEEFRDEIIEEMITKLLKMGKLSFEEIANATNRSVESVKSIAEKVTVNA